MQHIHIDVRQIIIITGDPSRPASRSSIGLTLDDFTLGYTVGIRQHTDGEQYHHA